MDESSNELYEPHTPPELVPLVSTEYTYRSKLRFKLSLINLIPRQLCLPSKAAVVILLWTAVVSAMYKTAGETALHIIDTKIVDQYIKDNIGVLIVYLVFVMVYVLYPLAGFLADIYCGRYKMVITSLCLLLCGSGCFCISSTLFLTGAITAPYYTIRNSSYYFTILGIGLLFLITGLSGYQANIIQLGLDQLLDVPSEYLGLFLHWLELFAEIGFFVPRLIFVLFNNCNESYAVYYSVLSLSFVFTFLVILLLIFGYWKRRWFYTEPGQRNPYKMVAKVLGFAWKHKYPLRRSAFTYNGDEQPSRIDFAKERYGGPFTTEQVEDVKTLFKLIIVLLVISSIFFMEIPVGPLLASFSNHIGSKKIKLNTTACFLDAIFHSTAVTMSISTIITFLMYIWLIYTVMRRCIPKTVHRILFGEVLFFVAVLSLFVIDTIGHTKYYLHSHEAAACVFAENNSNHSSHLDLPWVVNILPAFLMEVAVGVVITTTFEFISAQSPHSMKGVLIGIFYAFRGTFSFLGTISVLPFSLSVIWSSDYMKTHMPVITNCGFGYLLLSCTVGVISLVLFCVVAKRYKYRERDDPPFNQAIVERVWEDSLQSRYS